MARINKYNEITSSVSTHCLAKDIAPFALEMVQISKQDLIELRTDVKRWKELWQRSKDRSLKVEGKLHTTIATLKENATEKEANHQLEIAKLEAKVKDLTHRLFGKKSEKNKSRSDQAFIKDENQTAKPRGQQPGSKGHGRNSHRPPVTQEETSELSPDQAVCPCCGLSFDEMPGTDDADYIELEVKAYTRRVKRKRYKASCKCGKVPGIITAPMPPRLLSRNILGVTVWADILLDKFLYARPTYRLLQMYERRNLHISQGTVTSGFERLAPLFEPLRNALYAKQMTESRFFADETRWSVFEKVDGKTGNRWWFWLVLSPSTCYYILAPGRNADVIKEHFSDLDKNTSHAIVMCDRFSSYKCMAKQIEAITLAFCWAHVRRDFIKAARSYDAEKTWMLDWVEKIRELYRCSRERRQSWDESKALDDQSDAFNDCQKRLNSSIELMRSERDEYLSDKAISQPKRAVLTSLRNHWDGLTVFVKHPEVPMDNNISERGARKIAMLRNVSFGSGSQRSGHFQASVMSIMQTLIMWNINPDHWMHSYLQACANHGGKVPKDLTPFIPWEMSEERRLALTKSKPANST